MQALTSLLFRNHDFDKCNNNALVEKIEIWLCNESSYYGLASTVITNAVHIFLIALLSKDLN